MAKSIVLKDVQSPERLLDETALFLHRVVTDLPAEKQAMLERLHGSKEILRGRKVLVVDDDARNIFALTSLLENQEMEVISATNGQAGDRDHQDHADISMVLMDIMMPEMDGYETMRRDSQPARVPHAADPGPHRQGDEGRPREMPGRRGERLHRQAGQHRPAAVADASVAIPITRQFYQAFGMPSEGNSMNPSGAVTPPTAADQSRADVPGSSDGAGIDQHSDRRRRAEESHGSGNRSGSSAVPADPGRIRR